MNHISSSAHSTISVPWGVVIPPANGERHGFADRLRQTPRDKPAAPAAPAAPDLPPNLPLAFWATSPELMAIREFAHCRYVSADAVLGCLFVHIAANTPRGNGIATFMHPQTSVNFFAVTVGGSEAGKTLAASVAREIYQMLLPCEEHPVGTGQGMAEAFMSYVPNPSGKGAPIKQQTRHNLLFKADEGAALIGLLEAKDYDLAATLCSAWTGEPLGRKNATQETTRLVTNYCLGVRLNLQPHLISALIQHAGIGLVARFAFFSATDTSDEERFGKPAPLPAIKYRETGYVGYDESIQAEATARRIMGVRGELITDPLDKHYMLMLFKMSYMLMYIEGRSMVSAFDWARAKDFLWPNSCGVRDYAVHKAEEQKDAEIAEQAAIAAVKFNSVRRGGSDINNMANRIRRHLLRCPDATRRQIRDACVNRKREGEQRLFAQAFDMIAGKEE